MSSYVNIELSEYNFRETIDALEAAVMTQNSFYEVSELVHLIDLFHEEYERDKGKQNKELERWAEQQKLLVKNEKPNPQLFLKIQEIIDKSEIEFDFNESQFHFICDLIELFEEFKKETKM